MTERLLTTRDVAERIGIAPETVLRWVDTRGLPARRLTSRAIRYDEDELDRWLLEHPTGAADRGVDSYPTKPRPGPSLRPAILPGDSYPVGDADATTEEEP